ncbi:hypothetical protein [Falsiroseomonas sp.]|uniref:hypothetical protein n=1 Tax=Falsiroseomonas sp. TaxID=2870721 RepID=UPI0027343A84|nr:hypothetical protein [Falsiroseomonas sp.]MDP3417839.1 hypothetical protein [Falsiroseomonas sp.]
MHDRTPDRLFRLLPGHHRALDAGAGAPLQALMRLLAGELDIVEADLDQLYDNWFIETCEPWAIPYIGDLVGARRLRPFGEDGGAPRAHVANTLAYRQAKGAVAALEALTRDATGWPALAVEFFERLAWTQNLNHLRPAALGTASLRDAEAARMTGSAFGQHCHAAAAGLPASPAGRFNIPVLGLFVWRLQAQAIGFVADAPGGYLGGPVPRASAIGPGFRRFDPLGADRPLFNRPRADVDLAARATARNLPVPLDRRLLHRDLEALRAGRAGGGDWFRDPPALRIRLDGAEVPPARLHACNLEDRDDGAGGITWRRPAVQGEVFLDPELGRLSLHPADETKTVETAHAIGSAFDAGAGPQDRRASVEAWRGLCFVTLEPPPWRIGVSGRAEEVTNDPGQGGPVVGSLATAIEAWNTAASTGARRGVIALLDSATHAEDLTTDARLISLPDGARLALVAAGWPLEEIPGGARRRVAAALSPGARRPHIRSALRVAGAAGSVLVLDGLLVEGGLTVEDGALAALQLRHCTLGAAAEGLPGGVRVAAGNGTLRLVADHTILGRAELGTASGGVVLHDSILGEDRSADTAPDAAPLLLDAPDCDLDIARSTLFGAARGRTLEAENSIFRGRLDIARRQEGCVRYCFVPPASGTPGRFRCVPDLTLAEERARLGRDLGAAERGLVIARVTPQFASSAFNTTGFGNLAPACPREVAEGAEEGGAMGAGFRHGEPARRANLRDALEEHLPFGLHAGVIFAT